MTLVEAGGEGQKEHKLQGKVCGVVRMKANCHHLHELICV